MLDILPHLRQQESIRGAGILLQKFIENGRYIELTETFLHVIRQAFIARKCNVDMINGLSEALQFFFTNFSTTTEICGEWLKMINGFLDASPQCVLIMLSILQLHPESIELLKPEMCIRDS